MATTFTKDPNAVLDYVFDWTAWLRSGESIAVSQITVSNTNVNGLTVNSTANDASTATIWLAGGVAGRVYSVVNQITTDMGRTELKSINIRVADR